MADSLISAVSFILKNCVSEIFAFKISMFEAYKKSVLKMLVKSFQRKNKRLINISMI